MYKFIYVHVYRFISSACLESTSARSGYHYIDYFEVTQLNNARDTINF